MTPERTGATGGAVAAADPAAKGRFVDIAVPEQPLLRLHFHDLGRRHDARPPVVLLHGSGPGATGLRNFAANIEPLLAQGFRVLVPDWPGWGASDPVVCTGSRSHLNAEILRCFLDAIGLQAPVTLVGNSMGAHSAVAFAAMHGKRVYRLVLAGGGNGARGTPPTVTSEGFARIVAFYEEPSRVNLRRLMESVVHDPALVTDEIVEARFALVREHPAHLEAYRESHRRSACPYPDLGDRIASIDAPTLILWGRQDRVVPIEVGLHLAATLPHADMHIFGRCGHVPQSERPEDFNRLVLDFLAPA